jgi:hypothetical protein
MAARIQFLVVWFAGLLGVNFAYRGFHKVLGVLTICSVLLVILGLLSGGLSWKRPYTIDHPQNWWDWVWRSSYAQAPLWVVVGGLSAIVGWTIWLIRRGT